MDGLMEKTKKLKQKESDNGQMDTKYRKKNDELIDG